MSVQLWYGFPILVLKIINFLVRKHFRFETGINGEQSYSLLAVSMLVALSAALLKNKQKYHSSDIVLLFRWMCSHIYPMGGSFQNCRKLLLRYVRPLTLPLCLHGKNNIFEMFLRFLPTTEKMLTFAVILTIKVKRHLDAIKQKCPASCVSRLLC